MHKINMQEILALFVAFGEAIRSKSVLANANTTKPLQRCNGLVVLAFANKSGVPRVLGWPGVIRLFSSIRLSPRIPPLARIGYAR